MSISTKISYDLIVVGAGAAGMISAITAARCDTKRKILLLEKLPKIGAKLRATGGGRCNLTNTLSNNDFMAKFGREGRFMTTALTQFDYKKLQNFFLEIGVASHAPDGYRIFPTTHNAGTIIEALKNELQNLNIETICDSRVIDFYKNNNIFHVKTTLKLYHTNNIIVATGGLGYPTLGAEGDGFTLASNIGHKITDLSPAMMPLHTKERWVENCRADTIAKVEMKVDLPKSKKLTATGDLIFTKSGIRGPVVLDFAREITPLLKKRSEIPILMNLTKGKNEQQIQYHLQDEMSKNPHNTIIELISTLLPVSLSKEICKLCEIDETLSFTKQKGTSRDKLYKILAWTPLTINGHDGFKMAMITRGGVSLKEISPETMQSKLVNGLYFCGEVMNLDGPCGGYNLQWSFASGYLAGKLLK